MINACTRTCMCSVCVCVCLHTYVCPHVYTSMYGCVSICMWVCMRMCPHVYASYVCMCTHGNYTYHYMFGFITMIAFPCSTSTINQYIRICIYITHRMYEQITYQSVFGNNSDHTLSWPAVKSTHKFPNSCSETVPKPVNAAIFPSIELINLKTTSGKGESLWVCVRWHH